LEHKQTLEKTAPARQVVGPVTGEVVTAQHSDYTGSENATFGAGNHRQIHEKCLY
jgi:hypothetical protein